MKHKFREGLRGNWVFLALLLAVILLAVLLNLRSHIGENPFSDLVYVDSPVTAVTAQDVRYYVTNAGGTILVVDRNNQYIRRIDGYNEVNSFASLTELAAGENGTFYVIDQLLGDDEVTAEQQRVLRFTDYGARCEVLYEEATAQDGVQIVLLKGLTCTTEGAAFARLSDDGIEVIQLTADGPITQRFLSYPQAHCFIFDCALSAEGQVAVVTMGGKVLCWPADPEAPFETIPSAEPEEGYTLVSEVTFGDEDLYLLDVGQHTISRVGTEVPEPVVGPYTFGSEAETLSATPLYTGLNVSNGELDFLISEFYVDEEEEQIYSYLLAVTDTEGNEVLNVDSVIPSLRWRIQIIAVYVALALSVLLCAAAVILLVRTMRSTASHGSHTQIILLIGIMAASLAVGTYVFRIGTSRYVASSTDNLSNIARLIAKELPSDAVKQLNSPEDYGSEAYKQIDAVVNEDLHLSESVSSSIYAVLYRVRDDVVCEAYRNAAPRPILYPLAGTYTDSVEEWLAESGEMAIVNGMAMSEGTFSYVETAIYDENGDFIALLEVGESYAAFTAENDSILRSVLIQVFMVLIIIMLLMTEFVAIADASSKMRKARWGSQNLPPETIRPVAFLAFFTANITTAFLPIYSMSLWTESFPLQQEIAAALPLSAELICGAGFSLLCGRWLRTKSPRSLCSIGALCYICGNLGSIIAKNIWMLICANSLCGVGSGLLLVSINTWIACQEDERCQNQGFIHYNAAYLSGLNCGSVVGALVWENFGIPAAYLAAGISALILLLAISYFMDFYPVSMRNSETGRFRFKQFFTPGILRYFLFLVVPYLICASFLSYFFPIIAEENNLSAPEISMAFLISGVISIYVGAELGDTIVEKLGVRKSMVLASFMYAIALMYLVFRPSISSCYAVIVIFALADSFGLAAQAVHFADREEVKLCGESRSLAVNSTVESITSACGSLIFGAALMMGYRLGIFIIGLVFTILLLAYLIGEKFSERKHSSAAS